LHWTIQAHAPEKEKDRSLGGGCCCRGDDDGPEAAAVDAKRLLLLVLVRPSSAGSRSVTDGRWIRCGGGLLKVLPPL
jgi:hypothetical protein